MKAQGKIDPQRVVLCIEAKQLQHIPTEGLEWMSKR